MAETFTIRALADAVGMTVRNIRAYQSRGLLHSPEIHGRVAYYNSAHVARLELVASLQREGFTLAAIKRLIDTPESYAAIVADRRRRFREGTSDISASAVLPVERIREVLPGLPDDLTASGLAWMENGRLVTHSMLMGIGKTLAGHGLPPDLLARLQLEAAHCALQLGGALRGHLEDADEDDRRHADLARIAVQLSAAAFEIAFLSAARKQ